MLVGFHWVLSSSKLARVPLRSWMSDDSTTCDDLLPISGLAMGASWRLDARFCWNGEPPELSVVKYALNRWLELEGRDVPTEAGETFPLELEDAFSSCVGAVVYHEGYPLESYEYC